MLPSIMALTAKLIVSDTCKGILLVIIVGSFEFYPLVTNI